MEKEQKLKNFIINKLELEADSVELSTNLVDDLHLDSLDRFEMIAELEDEFNVRFPEEDLESIETVKDLLNVIENSSAA